MTLTSESSGQKTALVLTAGGARGAYQAGVLKRIGELARFQNKPSPFQIVSGASAGAINGASVAAGADNFSACTAMAANLWSGLKTSDIYRTDIGSLGKITSTLLRDLVLGGLIGGGTAQSLLDASPLKKLLQAHLPFSQIQENIYKGHLYALAVSATNYGSGKSFTFVQGAVGHPTWEKSRRIALPSKIGIDHICASAAIPIVFAPVLVETQLGNFYFGDGGLRQTTPLSPAIRLGAQKVFAIGIRSQNVYEARSAQEMSQDSNKRSVMKKPPLAQVIGVILNSIFLDHLDSDAEHLKRMNRIVKNASEAGASIDNVKEPIHFVDQLVLNPSEDMASIAESYASKMPPLVRYLLEGLGSSKSDSADLMSYVLFDNSYTRELIDLGYKDACDQIDEVDAFLNT